MSKLKSNSMNYQELLTESFQRAQLMECPCGSQLEFLAQSVFDFTTYDSEMDELLGAKAIEVMQSISAGATFDYIQDPEQYRWYIVMCNMPFFGNRLEWGTSIRGAWWDNNQPPLECDGLFLNGKQITSLAFTDDEWLAFADAVISFAAEPKEPR